MKRLGMALALALVGCTSDRSPNEPFRTDDDSAAADTSPPTVPGNLHITSTTENSITLDWNESTDDVGVDGYNVIQWTGAAWRTIAYPRKPPFTVGELSSGTSHSFRVSAFDAAWNTSPETASVDARTKGEPAPTSGFRVDGARILAPDGSPFVARGVNIQGQNFVWNRSVLEDLPSIRDCWGFNFVRLNNFVKSVGTACADGQYPRPECHDNDDIQAIIDAFTEKHIVVLLDAHDWTGTYPTGSDLDLLVNWHRQLAIRNRDNPYVWFNVTNEPGGGHPKPATDFKSSWLGMHQTVIRAIRNDAGANNVIVADGIGFAQENGHVASADQPAYSAVLSYGQELLSFDGRTYPNIVFGLHVYEQWGDRSDTGDGATRLGTYLDRVRDKGFAMLVGEYGILNAEFANLQPSVRALYAAATPRNVGHVVWHWWGAGNHLTQGSGGDASAGWRINSCTAPTNLSACLGQAIWDDKSGVAAPRCN